MIVRLHSWESKCYENNNDPNRDNFNNTVKAWISETLKVIW